MKGAGIDIFSQAFLEDSPPPHEPLFMLFVA